jgi:tetratricopeptide (TPR) repeat protein
MPEARFGLAEVARRRGEYERALAEVDGAAATEHVDPGILSRLVDFRAVLVTEQAKVAELELHAAEGGATPEELDGLAEVYAGRGRWQDAADLQAGTVDTPERRSRLAYLLFRAGRYRDALAQYTELASAGDPASLLNSGVTLAKLGDDLGALTLYDRVLEGHPDDRLARLYRANSLLRLGRRADAAAGYRAFLDQDQSGEAAERVRRILKQIAPELVPPETSPIPEAPPPPEPAAGTS